MVERIICLLIGYVCGLLQTAYLYGRLKHIDIREYGSGNAGTTNALRTLGKKAGLITFAGDFFKPMLAALLVFLIFKNRIDIPGSYSLLLLMIYAGTGAVLGHIFPVYLGFRGGKGIATIAGMSTMFCILADCWYVVPLMMLLFVVVVAATKYVSLGSIVIVSAYFVLIIILGQTGHVGTGNLFKNLSCYFEMHGSDLYEVYALIGIYSAIAVFKHHANIKRLIKGEENKIFSKKEK